MDRSVSSSLAIQSEIKKQIKKDKMKEKKAREQFKRLIKNPQRDSSSQGLEKFRTFKEKIRSGMTEVGPRGIFDTSKSNKLSPINGTAQSSPAKLRQQKRKLQLLQGLGRQMGIQMASISEIEKEIQDQRILEQHHQQEEGKFQFAATQFDECAEEEQARGHCKHDDRHDRAREKLL